MLNELVDELASVSGRTGQVVQVSEARAKIYELHESSADKDIAAKIRAATE